MASKLPLTSRMHGTLRTARRTPGPHGGHRGLAALAITTSLSLICASLAGCGAAIELRPDQLPSLAPYQQQRSVEITSAGNTIEVEPSRTPRLALRGLSAEPISPDAGYSDLILEAPLERFRFESTRVILLAEGPPGQAGLLGARYRSANGDYEVPLSAIRVAEMRLRGPKQEPRELRLGAGASIAGPSRLLSANLELRIFRYAALETGLASFGPPGLAWVGAKALSPRMGQVALFTGAFAGMFTAGEGAELVTDYGLRFGVEIMFNRWSDAVALEFDVLRQHSTDSYQGCRQGRYCPFGGASYVHFF